MSDNPNSSGGDSPDPGERMNPSVAASSPPVERGFKFDLGTIATTMVVTAVLSILGTWFAVGQDLAVLKGTVNRLKETQATAVRVEQGELISLRTFESVIETVAENVFANAQRSLYFAVDVPAYGAKSQEFAFKKYRKHLQDASTRNISIKAMWLPEPLERRYIENVELLDSESMISESGVIRMMLDDFNPREIALPQLASVNFWVARDDDGNYHSVIAWILETKYPASVQGFYTQSSEIGKVLEFVWQDWIRRSDPDRLGEIYELFLANQDER